MKDFFDRSRIRAGMTSEDGEEKLGANGMPKHEPLTISLCGCVLEQARTIWTSHDGKIPGSL